MPEFKDSKGFLLLYFWRISGGSFDNACSISARLVSLSSAYIASFTSAIITLLHILSANVSAS